MNKIIFTKEEVRTIEILRNWLIASFFIPTGIIVVPIISYKLYKKISYTVLYSLGMFAPVIHWVVLFALIVDSNKIIKGPISSSDPDVMYFGEDLSEDEDEITIDEKALNKYFNNKNNKKTSD